MLKVELPKDWRKYDVLYITAKDNHQQEIFTWSFPIVSPREEVLKKIDTLGESVVTFKEEDSLWRISAANIHLAFKNGLLAEVKNGNTIIPLRNSPVEQEGALTHFYEGKNLIIQNKTFTWTIYPSGIVKMKIRYFPAAYFTSCVGVNFTFPENEMKAVEYMGNGPYRVWKNRLKGPAFGVWHKDYNNTETGESWNYPEFKGYYAKMYWCKFITNSQPFTVYTETEDLFLRLFTPAWKTDQWHNYEPTFPDGNLSFMQGISGIGTKTQRAETTGPMGMQNIFYDYGKNLSRALQIILYFDFSGK